MKKFYFASFICALLSLVSCTQEMADNGVDSRERARQNTTSQEVILNAFDADAALSTKTVRDESTGGVLWSPGDAINLFYGPSSGAGSFFVAQNTEPSSITTFRGNIDVVTGTVEGSTDLLFWGIYPYNSANRCTGESANILLPDIQRSGENSWGEGALVSVGRSQGLAMGFYNLLGGIIFYVTNDDIREIVFRGKNNEPIAGSVTVAFNGNTPTITAYQDTVASLHLLPPSTYTRQAFKKTTAQDTTWYFMTLPPRVYSGGHTITFYKNDGTYAVRDFPSRTITRNKFTRIRSNSLDNGVEFVYPQLENNQIRYTATAKVDYTPGEGIINYGNVVESNIFDATTHKGTITFANAITGLDHDAFSGNENLISVTLPEGLEEIEFRAFYQCPNLVSVDIPSSVNQIGVEAFSGCISLDHIYVPELIGLGVAAFANCLSLRSFSGPHASADGKLLVLHLYWNDEDWLMGCALKSFENQDLIIPEGIEILSKGVFAGGKFASVSIPETVKEIEESCFESCEILSRALTIPHSVDSIGRRAFRYAILDEITFAPVRFSDGVVDIPRFDIPSIGARAFDTNGSQRVIRIPGAYALYFTSADFTNSPWLGYKDYIVAYQADNEIWYSQLTGGGGSELAKENSILGENGSPLPFWAVGNFYPSGTTFSDKLEAEPCTPLPAEFHAMPIIVNVYQKAICGIGAEAFRQVSNQYISLPDGVTSIGNSAFYQCASLQVFPSSGARLTSIGDYAFCTCSNMTFRRNSNYMDLKNVVSIGAYAFSGCVNFGSGSEEAGSILKFGPVTTIPEYAFQNCEQLTHIYLSDNVIESVGRAAFSGCEKLKALTEWGDSVDSVNLPLATTIGDNAFASCEAIEFVSVGSSGHYPTLGQSAFNSCTALLRATIPYVKKIGALCFYQCQNLLELHLDTVHSVGDKAFGFTRKMSEIHFGKYLNTLGELIFYDNSTDNSVRNYDKLTLYFNGSYPTLVSALNSTSPTFGYTSPTNYFWPKSIRVQNQSRDVLDEYYTRLRVDWNEAIRDKIHLHQIQ